MYLTCTGICRLCWPFLSLVIAALIRGQEWRMKGASRTVKGTRHRICRCFICRICDLVYYRVRVVVGEGLSGYPQIGTRGTEGYGQHFGRCSSMISIPIPCCSCSCSCCLIIVIVVVGFAEVVIVRIRSHAGKRGEAEAWMMDQSQHESWDDIAII